MHLAMGSGMLAADALVDYKKNVADGADLYEYNEAL